MFRVDGADLGLEWQRHGKDVVEGLDELVDGGVAKFGIGGVGHAAFGAEFDAEGALGGEGEAVVGGFAVDEKLRAFGRFVGDDGSGGVALFADEEEQADLDAGFAEAIGCGDLCGDDALWRRRSRGRRGTRRLRCSRRRAGRCPCGWRGRCRG